MQTQPRSSSLFRIALILFILAQQVVFSAERLTPQQTKEVEQLGQWLKEHMKAGYIQGNAAEGIKEGEDSTLETYWKKLKQLGEHIDADTSLRLQSVPDLSREEAVAVVAKQYAEDPTHVGEIEKLCGYPPLEVPFEIINRHFPNRFKNAEAYRISVGSSRFLGSSHSPGPEMLKPAFKAAWEAWLLAPIGRKSMYVRQRLFNALEAVHGNAQTAKVALFWMHALADYPSTPEWKYKLTREYIFEFEKWGNPEQQLEWMLQWLTIGEQGGFADAIGDTSGVPFRDMVFTALTWRGERSSEERHKKYIPVVRAYDLSKLPQGQQKLLKKVMAIYKSRRGE